MTRSRTLDDPRAVQALTHPVRVQVLEALREPGSAAGVAKTLGQSRQNVNYHLKELERAGLVVATGERRRGNLVEPLFQSVARSFVVSPRVAWGDDRRLVALQDQISLEQLVGLGEQLQQDASALLDRAAFDGEEIASASVTADVAFPDEQSQREFMREYLEALGPMLKKHGARDGAPFRVVVAVYPQAEEGEAQ